MHLFVTQTENGFFLLGRSNGIKRCAWKKKNKREKNESLKNYELNDSEN